MMSVSHQTHHDGSALGCRLHAWDLSARESGSHRRTDRGVVLDLDDTLYPHEHFVLSGLMAVARHLEETHEISAPEAFAVMSAARRQGERRHEFQSACARFGLSADLVPELLEVFRVHRPVLRLPRASAAALATLRSEGWGLVVLTNGLPAVQRRKVAALGIEKLVDSVAYADEHAAGGKPAAGAFLEGLRRLGVPARHAVCVGDDLARDIAGARRVGLKTVRVARAAAGGPAVFTPAGEAVDAKDRVDHDADAVISSLLDLPEVARHLIDDQAIDAA
jgi:putative hydrolase of the HAD superfamily